MLPLTHGASSSTDPGTSSQVMVCTHMDSPFTLARTRLLYTTRVTPSYWATVSATGWRGVAKLSSRAATSNVPMSGVGLSNVE